MIRPITSINSIMDILIKSLSGKRIMKNCPKKIVYGLIKTKKNEVMEKTDGFRI